MPTITRKEMIIEDVKRSLELDRVNNSRLTQEYRDYLAREILKTKQDLANLQEELDAYDFVLGGNNGNH